MQSVSRHSAVKRRIKRNRSLHHRLFLHPASVLLLLCVGVLLGGLTFRTAADSIVVTGVVEAPIPSTAATIDSPSDQTHFQTRPITVTGTCPQNTYVKLFRNGNFSGVTICGSGVTTYSIQTDLSLGANELIAQVYNVTDQAGPPSGPITVFYENPPQPSTASPSSPALNKSSLALGQLRTPTLPFFISADFRYQARLSGKPFNLELGLTGGTAPYALTVQWGDGSTSTIVRGNRSQFSLEHTYTLSKRSLQVYIVKIQAVDSDGSAVFLDIAQIVRGEGSSSGAPFISDTIGTTPFSQLKQWVWFAWPVYGVTILMVFSFWLGERQEYLNLIRHKRPRRA